MSTTTEEIGADVCASRPSIAAAFLRRLGLFLERQWHRVSRARLARERRCELKWQQPWPADKPLLTVVIPCFNYGRFVEGAIRSVLSQTFQRFEIIVIDDGSTDAFTVGLLENLRCEKTRVLRQPNQGLADTRNNGARMAAGKYICYLDADDVLEPQYFEKTLAALEADEALGCCFSWVRCFGKTDSVWQTQDLDPFFLRQYTTAPSHSVIRKDVWEKLLAFNGAGFVSKYNGYFEDWVFWIDMVQCGYGGRAIPEPLIRYRVHDESLGARHRSGFDLMLRALKADRVRFFEDSSYRKQLARCMNHEIRIVNRLLNLDPGDTRSVDEPAGPS